MTYTDSHPISYCIANVQGDQMSTITLKCQCGSVEGTATDITPASGNRVVCCCSDCQAFATHLGCDADTLDQFGGTEIFQTSQSQIKIVQGQDKLQSLRLTKKGMLRWYTNCCNTPVGNSMNASMPFFGVIHTFTDIADREGTLGNVRAYVQTQYAKGSPDYPHHSAKYPLGITIRIAGKLLTWKLQGRNKPTVFFSDDGTPVSKTIIVDEEN